MTSPNERIAEIRRALAPEVAERTNARIREQRSQAIATYKGIEWAQLSEAIRTGAPLTVNGDRAIDIRTILRKSSVVYACISAISTAFAEAYLEAQDLSGSPIVDHEVIQMLRRMPNGLSESDLAHLMGTYNPLGGCFLKKNRANDGRVLGLTPYHREQCRAVPFKTRSEKWISHYEFVDGGRVIDEWQPTEVIPFLWAERDPAAPWKCIAPTDALGAEICQDLEMTRYFTALLENDAVARTIITIPRPLPDMVSDPDAQETMREVWSQAYGGDNRGSPAVLGPGMTAQRLSLDLQEMAFDALRRVPEGRICMAFRTPAQVVGVTAGLDATYKTFGEANAAFTTKTIKPMWRNASDALTRGLAADFVGDWQLWHVTTDIAALQEDENAKAERERERSKRIQELQTAYVENKLTRDMAIANVVNELLIAEDIAAAYFPELPKKEPPAPVPDPSEKSATPPTESIPTESTDATDGDITRDGITDEQSPTE